MKKKNEIVRVTDGNRKAGKPIVVELANKFATGTA